MDQRIGMLARMELARAESVISEVLPRGQFFRFDSGGGRVMSCSGNYVRRASREGDVSAAPAVFVRRLRW